MKALITYDELTKIIQKSFNTDVELSMVDKKTVQLFTNVTILWKEQRVGVKLKLIGIKDNKMAIEVVRNGILDQGFNCVIQKMIERKTVKFLDFDKRSGIISANLTQIDNVKDLLKQASLKDINFDTNEVSLTVAIH